MEKQISTLNDHLEVKDLEINKVLRTLNIDHDQLDHLSKPLEEVREMKEQIVSELES